MILVSVFGALRGHEADLWGQFMALGHPLTNGGLCALGERFCVDVLGDEAGHVAVIPGYVLLAHLVLVAADPCGGVATAVAEHVFVRLILVGHALEGSFVVETHCGRLLGAVRNGRLAWVEKIDDLTVDIARCHAELVDFRGHVTRVTGHVLFRKAHFAVAGTQ